MNVYLTLLIALCVAVALAVALSKAGRKAAPAARVKARAFMTPNELEFLHRLETAVPEYRFHAQVAMGALLEPLAAKRGNGKEYIRVRNQFSQKVVDYVAQRRDTGQIVAIIELDDRTHSAARDAGRDAMLQLAGYRTIRWQSKSKPSQAEILSALVAPPATCQPAGVPLQPSTAGTTSTTSTTSA